jgi:hypothetical protein
MIEYLNLRFAGHIGSILTLCLILNWFVASACCEDDAFAFCFVPNYITDCVGCLPNQGGGAVIKANVVVTFRGERKVYNYLPEEICFSGNRQGGEVFTIMVTQVCQTEGGVILLNCDGSTSSPQACDEPDGAIRRVNVRLNCLCL